MGKSFKNSNHTGKKERKNEIRLTLDTNMISYLYALSSGNLTTEEYVYIRKALGEEGYRNAKKLINNNFEGVKIETTPQVMLELVQATKAAGYKGILDFACKICKIKIPRSEKGKEKYAQFVEGLMQKYIAEDVLLRDRTGVSQSAIFPETKHGKKDYSDAKIVSENAIANGSPFVTSNEKHLISVYDCKKQNNKYRSEAILIKNKQYLEEKNNELPKIVKTNLANPEATTYRPSEINNFLKL